MASWGSITADVLISSGMNDSASELRWSPVANHVAVSSWDNTLRIYDVKYSSGSRPTGAGVFSQDFPTPILSCDWSKDGTLVASGTADHKAFIQDLNAPGSLVQVAEHAAPIKSVRFVTVPGANGPILSTGSWDSTIKFWDLRQAKPLASLACGGKVYSMDSAGSLLAAVTSQNKIEVVDLKNPTAIEQTLPSNRLAHQIRVLSCFASGEGFALGGVEGRCAFTFIDPKKASDNFSFKAHRYDQPVTTTRHHGQSSQTDAYAVNAVSMHPIHATFSTAGSDGSFTFWDMLDKRRLKSFAPAPVTASAQAGSSTTATIGGIGGKTDKDKAAEAAGKTAITATGFNGDGSLFAYAVGYDWSKGYAESKAGREDRVMLHVVGNECSPVSGAVKR